MKQDLVFIASGGRTGTTFLGEQLRSAINDCWSEHEPDVLSLNWSKATVRIARFGLWHMVLGRVFGVAGLRPLGHRYLSGGISQEQCVQAIKIKERDIMRQFASRSLSRVPDAGGCLQIAFMKHGQTPK